MPPQRSPATVTVKVFLFKSMWVNIRVFESDITKSLFLRKNNFCHKQLSKDSFTTVRLSLETFRIIFGSSSFTQEFETRQHHNY